MKTSETLYRKKEWKELRLAAIEHVGELCEACGKTSKSGATLQLHHKKYISGRLPWEYSFSELSVLCKGCHAEIHGKIFATSNWAVQGDPNDLGELSGNCDFCGTELRFEHFISHELWGDMTVGTNCADFLCETKDATAQRKLLERKSRFFNPKKWIISLPGISETKRRGLEIKLKTEPAGIVIEINGHRGKKLHHSENEAKEALFAKLENDEIPAYFRRFRKNGKTTAPLIAQTSYT
jgi:hypothetical protein